MISVHLTPSDTFWQSTQRCRQSLMPPCQQRTTFRDLKMTASCNLIGVYHLLPEYERNLKIACERVQHLVLREFSMWGDVPLYHIMFIHSQLVSTICTVGHGWQRATYWHNFLLPLLQHSFGLKWPEGLINSFVMCCKYAYACIPMRKYK